MTEQACLQDMIFFDSEIISFQFCLLKMTLHYTVRLFYTWHTSNPYLFKVHFNITILSPPRWCFHLIVVRRFENASDPESYTEGFKILVLKTPRAIEE